MDAMPRHRRLAGALSILGLALVGPSLRSVEHPQGTSPAFADVTAEVGLAFTYQTGARGLMHLPEIMGAGVALLDFDNDNDLDVYLVQGGRLDEDGKPLPPEDHDRLFRSDLTIRADGTRHLAFTDVSDVVGLRPGGYGLGVAAADYDRDGWTDLLVTGYGALRLLRNVGGQRFEDAGARAGIADTGMSVSGTFFDYDRDGWLDLFVVRYIEYAPVKCVLPSGRRDYCGPRSYAGQPARLWHNASGRFEDVTTKVLGGGRPAPGLGVVSADLNGDGYPDVYAANDGVDNHLWLNRSGVQFEEDGLLSGVAVNRLGLPEAGMGVDAGDADGDGDLDLLVTNLTGETNTLYVNLGQGLFEDRTIEAGLGAPSLPFTGFGTRLVDYDNDGWLDVIVVNGAVHLTDASTSATPRALGQRNLLFHNTGGGRFAEDTSRAGPAFAAEEASRGLAVGDLDNDGDSDLVIANADWPARVLLNLMEPSPTWLGVRALTRDGRSDALGALLTLRRGNAPPLVRRAQTDGSYASAGDPRVIFGLGREHAVDGLDVGWPDGSFETFPPPPLRQYTTIRQGTGNTPRIAGQP